MTTPHHLHTTKTDGVFTLMIDNPKKANAIDFGVIESLIDAITQCGDDTGAIVIRGTGGKVFTSGFDISAIPEEFFIDVSPMNNQRYEAIFDAIGSCPVPVIAEMNGDAFGFGMEIACACDLRIVQRSAWYGMPPVKLGLVYSPRGLNRFVTAMGMSLVKELFLTAKSMTAERAYSTGFANFIEDPVSIDSVTGELAARIAGFSRNALSGTKYSLARLSHKAKLTAEEIERIKEYRACSYKEESFQAIKAAFCAKNK